MPHTIKATAQSEYARLTRQFTRGAAAAMRCCRED